MIDTNCDQLNKEMGTMNTISLETLQIDRANLLQSGGEGAVYEHQGLALKLYHRPDPRRSEKLKAFQSAGLPRLLPTNVFAPQQLIVDRSGAVAGFAMPLLPDGALPVKKLSQALFSQHNGLTLADELDLLILLCGDLATIHNAGLIVGDLNDHNISFYHQNGASAQPPLASKLQSYWLDVDSFQFGPFPCPVALDSFLDPHLYGVTELKEKSVFTPESDWYAFAVLLCKTLLKTHPYGGAHPQFKTLQARAQERIPAFHRDVTYPKTARPPQILSDALFTFLKQTFEADRREPPPLAELQALRHNLAACPQCLQQFAASLAACPFCYRRSQQFTPAPQTPALRTRALLQTPGIIVHAAVAPGAPGAPIVAIVRQDRNYRLLQLDDQAVVRDMALFSGQPGARFGFFQGTLVINPSGRDELLIVDAGGATPRLLETVNSERFEGEAVFAATPHALYRLAGGYLLRGVLHHGRYLEEIVASAHRRHTQLWASPYADHLAGYHRLFDAVQLFTIDAQGREHPFAPATPAPSPARRILAIDVAWDRKAVAFLWHQKAVGHVEHHLHIAGARGETLHQAIMPADAAPYDRLAGRLLNGQTLFHPLDEGVLKASPQAHSLLDDLAPFCTTAARLHRYDDDLLIQQPHALYFAQTE